MIYKKKIKINFVDFWPGFNLKDNYFTNLLKDDFEIEISNYPDIIFYSVFGNNNKNFKCTKIFFSGENIGPDFNNCDYSMCYDILDDPRHYRLPLYLFYKEYYDIILNKKIDDSLVNRKFCNYVVSNGSFKLRNDFFEKLSKYKKVDSGGRFMNNIGGPVDNKSEFISKYKFTIAFENNAYRDSNIGYTTEKIIEPMIVNSIPIYYGNERIDLDFNTKSFINYNDFSNEEELIEKIILLDTNNDEYLKMLKEPWLNDSKIPDNFQISNIKKFLFDIIYKNKN